MGAHAADLGQHLDQSQIGVASLYRYFGTKQLFTVKVGAYIWQMTLKKLEPLHIGPQYEILSGLEQVKMLLHIFHIFMEEHKPFLRFLSEFDNFVVREHLGVEHLQEYERCALNILPVMIRAIEKGVTDGTVRPGIDSTMFYYTVTDCLLSMCQKFAWGNVPNSDDPQVNKQALCMAIEMFIGYIRA